MTTLHGPSSVGSKKGWLLLLAIPFHVLWWKVMNRCVCGWKHCPFCGSGSQSVWARLIAFCKHIYHSWCAFVHFNQSRKCIHNFCGEKMHKGQWVAIGIIKPRSTPKSKCQIQPTTKKMWQSHAFLGNYINLNVILAIFGIMQLYVHEQFHFLFVIDCC